jgi:hypothetical protein
MEKKKDGKEESEEEGNRIRRKEGKEKEGVTDEGEGIHHKKISIWIRI